MTARIFAILAAVFLVTAVGLAALTPSGHTLALGLRDIDRVSWFVWAQSHSAGWLWKWVEQPILMRPLWLIPASIGVICAGMATTLSLGKTSTSHRRRS